MHRMQRWQVAAFLTLGLVAGGASRATGQEPKPPTDPAIKDKPASSDRSIAAQFAAIKAEFDAQQEVSRAALEKATTQREANELYTKLSPDDVLYSRRMVDLALTNPTDPTARDALVWVINKLYRSDEGAYGDEFARAAALLVRHHGDDPAAIAVGLNLHHVLTARRDALLLGFLASAKQREAKGVARLALAQYLERKAQFAEGARKHPGRQKRIAHGVIGADGKPHDEQVDEEDENYAYRLSLMLCDPAAIRAEAERLYREVIADSGDVPLNIGRRRRIEAALQQPVPTWNGKPITDDDRREFAKMFALPATLGSYAEGHLDEMFNLTPGKPAPDIDGVDLNGTPLKLSDYRGKVVVLVFWGSWCGPCMAAVPHERELAERLKDRPFAMLGVDCKEPQAAGQKAVQDHQIPWPNWHDGDGETDGPIVARYHIRGYPTVFVIDAQGIIRDKQLSGLWLDQTVDKLLAELDAKPAQ